MITIKDFMEIVQYKISEGGNYCWPCFGSNAYCITAWNGEHEGWSMNLTFDTVDQRVYVVEVCDYKNNRAYRYVNPEFSSAYFEYAVKNNPEYVNTAWDEIDFVDLDTDEDFKEKSNAIVMGVEYDTRVQIPLELDDNLFLHLAREAHERDITINKMVENILTSMIDTRNSTKSIDTDTIKC